MVSRSIEQILSKQSNKKFSSLFSQCRVGFLYVLKFLKSRSIKREIIFCAYNLPEMINIAENLNLKIKFCDIDYKTGFIDLKQLKEKVSKNTLAIVLTNMFNSYEDSQKIKKIATKFKITLIEDNAIYFDNFSQFSRNKIYSGNFGDYTIYSFPRPFPPGLSMIPIFLVLKNTMFFFQNILCFLDYLFRARNLR